MGQNIAEDPVMGKLKEGFLRFQKAWCISKNSTHESLVKDGQNPKALVIACSDSRVDPAILTDAKPGDIFVVRNVSNLVPPCEPNGHAYHGVSAAMEYAVVYLKVDVIIVIGHAGCGGIKSLMEEDSRYTESGFIGRGISIAKPAKDRVNQFFPNEPESVRQKACEQLSIQCSLDNLMTFPWISKAVEEGRLKLYGWYFDIATGELMQFDPEQGSFVTLVSSCPI